MTIFKSLPVLLWLAALFLTGWVLFHLPLATIIQTVRTLTLTQWFAWIVINLGIILIATQRWQVFNKVLQVPVSYWQLLMIRQAGQAVSFMTPGPQFGGEPLQIFWLWQRKTPIHQALLGLGLDRFYELWINFSVLLMSVLIIFATPASRLGNGQNYVLVLLLMLLMITFIGWLILNRPEQILTWLERLTHRWQDHPKLQQIKTHWQLLSVDLKNIFVNQKSTLINALIWSILGWVGLFGELWLLLSFFKLDLSGSTFMVIFVSMRMAFLLPLPGGLGTLEAAVYWAFQYLNLPAASALGLIALMRLRDALVLAFGIWCLRKIQIRE